MCGICGFSWGDEDSTRKGESKLFYQFRKILSKITRFVTRSGIITSNINLYSGKKLSTFLRRILFLRCSPLALNKPLKPQVFTNIVSTLSIGPTHKTTKPGRHDKVDRILLSFTDKFKHIYFADVGVSDGVSSLKLHSKIKSKLKYCYLLDRYTRFHYTKEWYGYNFYNNDNDLVYVQIFNILLLHVFPFFNCKIKNSGKKAGVILFDNPLLKEKGLKVMHFDIFKDVLEHKVNIVKCANVLNSPYFSNRQILRALKNINKSMLNNGYLFIIHNNGKYKDNIAMLVLQKNKNRFKVVLNYNNHEFEREAVNQFGCEETKLDKQIKLKNNFTF